VACDQLIDLVFAALKLSLTIFDLMIDNKHYHFPAGDLDMQHHPVQTGDVRHLQIP